MRSSSALVVHLLRQHATRISAKPTSLQTSSLVSVLPHLLRPESSALTSLYSLQFVVPCSVQAAQSQVRVTSVLITLLLIWRIFTLCSQHCYTCSAQICLTHIRSLFNSTGVLMSQSQKWQQADFGRHYSQYLAFTAKKASFYEVAHCSRASLFQGNKVAVAHFTCSHLHEQLWHAGSKNLYQAVVQQAADKQLYKGGHNCDFDLSALLWRFMYVLLNHT